MPSGATPGQTMTGYGSRISRAWNYDRGHQALQCVRRDEAAQCILPRQMGEGRTQAFRDFNAPLLRIVDEEEPGAWDHLQGDVQNE